MNKSPINHLQEMLIKEGIVPNYIFITGNNNCDKFICRVTCKDISADGLGNNKKIAKYNAAQNMLLLFHEKSNIMSSSCQLNKVQDNDSVSTKVNNKTYQTLLKTQLSPGLNYVGLLQEFCLQYKLQVLPSYKVIDETGPSHMKTFTMESSIGSIQETGIAHCKRSAKQEAARKLLQHLENSIEKDESFKNNLQKLSIEISDAKIKKSALSITQLSEKAMSIYISNNNNNNNNNMEMQNLITKNDHISLTELIDEDNSNKLTSKNDLQNLNKEMLDNEINEPILPVVKLLKETQPIYIKSISNNNSDSQDCANTNDYTNTSVELIEKGKSSQEILEHDLRKLNITISDLKINEPILNEAIIAQVPKNVQFSYNKFASNNLGVTNLTVRDCHNLFKQTYSTKISDDLKRKIKYLCELNNCKSNLINCESNLIKQMKEDIEIALRVELKRVSYANRENDLILICLRLMSTPIVAQFGMGKTIYEAENRAMCEIVSTILEFLK